MNVGSTTLTSKEYKNKTVTFIVNKDGQVSYSAGATETDKEAQSK